VSLGFGFSRGYTPNDVMGEARRKAQPYSVGQEAIGTVVKVLPYGVFARMENGVRAYIRRRQMSWAGDIDPRELVTVGEGIRGVVVELEGSDRCLELSHKDTLPDPWVRFVDRYGEGDVVAGTVKSLTAFGVFVEILPGVDGLVPLSELAPWPVERPEDAVWVGDDVEAVITRIRDKETREVRLSIRARFRQRQKVSTIWEELYSPDELSFQSLPETLSKGVYDDHRVFGPVDEKVVEKVRRILVVENDEQVRLPLVEWLHGLGFTVDSAKSVAEAKTKTREQSYGLVLLDTHLSDTDPLSFLRQVQEPDGSGVGIALMSMPEWIGEHAEDIEILDILEVFAKPLDLEEIRRLLLEIGVGQSLSSYRVPSEKCRAVTPRPSQTLVDAARRGAWPHGQLQAILDQLRKDARADAGVIFYLDPLSGAISIEAASGATSLMSESAGAYSLDKSPVKDVIFEGEPVFEKCMTGRVRKRFRKLLELIRFEACIGVPIEVDGEKQGAIFLFHQDKSAFSHYRVRDAQAAAVLSAAVIERRLLNQEAQSFGAFLASGELSASLGHEVHNKVSGLQVQLRNLQTDWRELRQYAVDLSEPPEFGGVQQTIDELVMTVEELSRTLRVFRQLMPADGELALDVNEAVRGAEALLLLHPIMRETKVKVQTKLDPGLPLVRGSRAKLQQVFLNLMLNAVQQMNQVSTEGNLRVTTYLESDDEKRPIKVRFSDNGPGIHRQLQNRIFSMGFSTRPSGTGLGLFISRRLTESMGGVLSLEESFALLGTTFLVELPAVPWQPGLPGSRRGG